MARRHIDTARIYGNEADVGDAIWASDVPRDKIFVTTKLWQSDYPRAEEAAFEALHRMRMSYVDLLLLHSPGQSAEARRAAWQAMEKLHAEVGARF